MSTLGDELLLYSDNSLYAYAQNKNKWYNKGTVANAVVSQKNVDVTLTSTFKQHYETINGVCFYAYQGENEAAALEIKVRIIDDSTSTIIADHVLAGTSLVLLAAGQIANSFVIFYREGALLRYQYITFGAPTTVSSAHTIGNTLEDFAATALINERLFVAWQDNVSGVDVAYVDMALAHSFPINLSASSVDYVALSQEGTSNLRLSYGDNTLLLDYDLATLNGPVTFASGLSATNATSIQDPDNANTSIIVYHQNADVSDQIGVKAARVTAGGTVTDLGFIVYAANLASKIALLNNQLYVLIHKKFNTGSGETRGYFLISFDGQIVASVANNVALKRGDYPLPALTVENDSLFVFTSQYYQFFDVVTPSPRTSTAVLKYEFDFSTLNNFYDAVLGKQLHTAGGVLYSYDANKVNEHSFLEIPAAPEAVAADISPDTGVGSSSISYPQTVQYCTVYAWNDSQGQIHRSAPSVPVDVSIPDSTTKVTLTIKPLTLTSKENVEIEVYRTEANGTTFYKVSALSSTASVNNATLMNDPSATTQTFIDVSPDTGIINKELLYTTGSVLENIAPLASKYAVTYKNRIFLLSADGRSIQYSKLFEENVGVGFNDALTMPLDSYGGDGVALGVLGDVLIIFKKRAIFGLNGDGPVNTGALDDYRQPTLITADVGCSDAGSIVSTPGGLMFKSEKGIYLLSANGGAQYIGAPVEAYNDQTITSATLLNSVNQVRFTTVGGTALVYDYFTNRWSTYENLQAVDGLIFQNSFAILRPTGKVLLQSGSMDDGNFIPLVLESSWIQMGGIQGFQRFYRMLVLGNYLNAHKVKVSFAYDFNNTFVDEVLIDATENFGRGAYGEGLYGAGVYGGDSNVYQFEVAPKRQKCEAVRFRIETFYDGEYGGDATFSNFNLVVGVKGTANKGNRSLTFGADNA